MKILVEVSARHAHLSREVIEKIFGKGYNLTVKRNLSQPGQFLSEEKISICANECFIENISILGPERAQTQIEISMTDSRRLRVDPPIRESGDLKGSIGCKIIGNKNETIIKEGVIIAKRHIHMRSCDALKANLSNGEKCGLKLETKSRSLIFGEVVVRISEKYMPAAHIDTDEANAAGISGKTFSDIISYH
jgi:putative phosphotransacetylase